MALALCSYPPHACMAAHSTGNGMGLRIELTSRFRRFCLCLILDFQPLPLFLMWQWLCSFRSFETTPLYRILS
jgi:hypothetical protein